MKDYKIGDFYMVRIAHDPYCGQDVWVNEEMPARFAGYNSKGACLWNYLDTDENDWPVIWAQLI